MYACYLQHFWRVGEEARNGCIVTADCGYRREAFREIIRSFGLLSVFSILQHLFCAHPYVLSSALNRHHEDQEVDGEEEELDDAHPRVAERHLPDAERACDRQSSFVINDSPSMGQVAFAATKPLCPSNVAQRRIKAVAIREHDTTKFWKVLRFMHALPQSIAKELDQWAVVPKPGVTTKDALFSGLEYMLMNISEARISQSCLPLTMDQQCADWFTLGKFRAEGTSAGLILQHGQGSRQATGLAPIPMKKTTVGQCRSRF